MPASSTFDPQVILSRLTIDRLRSYLEDCDDDLDLALDLYAWNAQIAAAFLEDLGRLEVVLRNRFDEALTALAASDGLPHPWYDHRPLFPGRGSRHILKVIAKAKGRAARHGQPHPPQSNVIAELGFGFWRFLCTERYLTSLWSPALASRFPHHPTPNNAVQIQIDVESRIDRLHFLRNRVAHHEPLHRRELAADAALILELIRWMCSDTYAWMADLSRIPAVLASRPA
ncbi:hypothetical protein [Candidatus Poriferisocius sp.]|uniref:hypothetical protein n=1 Tax=Candidatus Poriferisocius sp. TaxID=3101276 RepID=UPI003B529C95